MANMDQHKKRIESISLEEKAYNAGIRCAREQIKMALRDIQILRKGPWLPAGIDSHLVIAEAHLLESLPWLT